MTFTQPAPYRRSDPVDRGQPSDIFRQPAITVGMAQHSKYHCEERRRGAPGQASWVRLNDAVDQEAWRIAEAVCSGQQDERQGRWEIAVLVLEEAQIHEWAARKAVSCSRQTTDDIAAAYRELLEEKVAGPEPALDLARVASGSSVCGWAKGLLGSLEARKLARRLVFTSTVRTVPVSHSDSQLAACTVGIDGQSDFDWDDQDQAFMAAAASFEVLSAGKRANEVIHLSARSLCSVYHLPAPKRGLYLSGAAGLFDRLMDSVDAARDDITDTVENPDGGYRGLAVLWDQYPIKALEPFCEVPALAVQRIALSALTPIPPMNKMHLTALRDALVPVIGSLHAAGRLASTWANLHTEATASEYGPHPRPRVKSLAARVEEQHEWERAVSDVLNRGCTKLGATPDAVRSSLTALARQTIGEPLLVVA